MRGYAAALAEFSGSFSTLDDKRGGFAAEVPMFPPMLLSAVAVVSRAIRAR